MSEIIPIPKMEIKVKDVYSLGDLIKTMYEWLHDNNYVSLEGQEIDNSNFETLYTHKVTGGGAVMDIWMWWRLLKYPMGANPKTSHVRYRLNLDIHFLGDSGEVEVMHKGKKVKLNKGEVKIEIFPFVEMDYRNEWEKEGILKLVKDVFHKKMYKKEIEEHCGYIYGEAYKFQGLLKQFFKLEGFMPEETTPVPPKGLL